MLRVAFILALVAAACSACVAACSSSSTFLFGHVILAIGNRLVIVGGTSIATGGVADAFVGNVANDGGISWHATTPSSFATRLGCAVLVGDSFYVLGGRHSDSTSDVERGTLQPNGDRVGGDAIAAGAA